MNELHFEEWLQHAEAGHPEAQARIGIAYLNGQGVEADTKTAITWFKKGAAQNDPTAIANLGWLHIAGDILPVDFVLGYKLLIQASAQGSPVAKEILLKAIPDVFAGTDIENVIEQASYPSISISLGPPADERLKPLFDDYQEHMEAVDREKPEKSWLDYEKDVAKVVLGEPDSINKEMLSLISDMFGVELDKGKYFPGYGKHPTAGWICVITISLKDLRMKNGFPVAWPPDDDVLKAFGAMFGLALERNWIKHDYFCPIKSYGEIAGDAKG